MTKEQILKKAIEKAVKNGWVPKIQWKANPELYQSAIVFSHDFAKAFWKLDDTNYGQGSWDEHLQQMVLEKDPIKYLEKFI